VTPTTYNQLSQPVSLGQTPSAQPLRSPLKMVTIDDQRRLWTEDTRAKLKAQGCPPEELEWQTNPRPPDDELAMAPSWLRPPPWTS
jgi:hypothetical protein